MATEFSPAAPPPPMSTAPLGSMPWWMVISSIAPTMFSVASLKMAEAASWRESPSGSATSFEMAFSASEGLSVIAPPRK